MSAFTFFEGMQFFIFPIFISLSVIIGLIWMRDIASEKEANQYLDIGVGLLFGALIGSRIFYIFFEWDHFKDHWIEIPQLQLGGYSWAGAVLGWILAVVITGIMTQQSALQISDTFLPLGGCLIIGIWLGCWFDGVAYGYLSDRWWAIPAIDEWGVIDGRFPVQFIGAISTWLLMMSVDGLKNHPEWKHRFHIPGKPTALFISVLSLIVFLLTFFRVDPAPVWREQRLDFWIALVLLLISAIMFGIIEIKHKLTARKSSFMES